MSTFPDTRTKAVFMDVAAGAYPDLYYGAGESGPVMASMNAGNSGGLYVGGDGINAGFARALAAQDVQAYATLQTMLAKATAAGATTTQTDASGDPVATMTLVNKGLPGARDYTGLAFMDVFADTLCPHGNGANRGMLYLAPPYGGGYTDKAQFLDDISAVGVHGIEATSAYNAWAADNAAPAIGALRLCMYSSGIYRMAGVTMDEVALAICAGVESGLVSTGVALSEIQMPVSDDPKEPYFGAYKAKLGG